MTIADLSFCKRIIVVIKMILHSECGDHSDYSFVSTIENGDVSKIKILGRGGLEVGVDDVKQSVAFKELQNLAKETVANERTSTGR